jgi:Zn-dependent M28 family amino/carboxypeptidase
MLSLEMIGYFSDTPDSQSYPVSLLRAFYPSQGNFIAVVGSLSQGGLVRRVKRAMIGSSSLPVYSINAPRLVPGVDFSDHLSYWKEGYEAVMITDTAFYRNHNYHTANDTSEKLDYRRMALVLAGVYGAVIDLSSSE